MNKRPSNAAAGVLRRFSFLIPDILLGNGRGKEPVIFADNRVDFREARFLVPKGGLDFPSSSKLFLTQKSLLSG